MPHWEFRDMTSVSSFTLHYHLTLFKLFLQDAEAFILFVVVIHTSTCAVI